MKARETVFERAGAGHSVVIRSDASRLTGWLDIQVDQPEMPQPAAGELVKVLQESKVKFLPDLGDRLSRALAAGAVEGLLVAEGKPPQAGPPGRIDWQIDVSTERKVKMVDDRADYREVKGIVQVEEGKELLKVVPPGTGPAGEDILGQEIPGLEGAPAALHFGSNVRFDPATATAYAEATGAVEFTGDRVSVVPIFTVEGDVSSETGNIYFAGEVFVKGDVQDDFTIQSKKDITIHGSVGASRIETEGDITIHHGASGRERGELSAGGKIQAKYLNAVRVTCRGDLVVSNEIMNCPVRTSGHLSIGLGRIVGGEIVALRGIESRQIGSPSNIPTRITVGIDIDTAQKIAQLKEQLEEIHKERDRIYNMYRLYIDEPAEVQKLPERKRGTILMHLQAFEDLGKQKQDAEAQLSGLDVGDAPEDEQFVRVTRAVYGNVTISIGHCVETFTKEFQGPVKFMAGSQADRLQRW